MAEATRAEKLSPKDAPKSTNAAKLWQNNPHAPKAAQKAVEEFLLKVPLNEDSTVIELGCGKGLCTELIARKVGAVLGLDTSKSMIKQFEVRASKVDLQGRMAGVRMELRNAKQLQDYIPDEGGFDAAFSHRALHHLPNFGASLRVLVQVLRPGGWLFVTDVEAPEDSKAGTSGSQNGSTHRDGLTMAELSCGLAFAGLVDVSVGKCFSLTENEGKKQSQETWYLRGLGRKPRKSSSELKGSSRDK